MSGQSYYGLPNGRMVVNCTKCGFNHDLAKWGWTKVVCQSCRAIIDHPIAGIKTSKIRGIKTNVMLSEASRDLLYTIAETHECSQSEAINMILKFAFDEFKAAKNTVMFNPKDQKHWDKVK